MQWLRILKLLYIQAGEEYRKALINVRQTDIQTDGRTDGRTGGRACGQNDGRKDRTELKRTERQTYRNRKKQNDRHDRTGQDRIMQDRTDRQNLVVPGVVHVTTYRFLNNRVKLCMS